MPLYLQYVKKSGDSITVAIGGGVNGLTINQNDTTNNPKGLQIFNAGTGTDFEVENTVNDANFNIRTSGTGKAAFGNLFSTAADYINIAGWVSDVLKWRVGRQGDTDGLSIYTSDGNTKAIQFHDSLVTEAIGDVKLSTVGKGLYVKEGSNATMGVATLVAGTVVVSTTKVTANSRIFLTAQTLGTVTVGQGMDVSARTAGTSFTIKSGSAIDTSTVAWILIEPS